MIGAMVGTDGVIVSVTADIDFTKENRVEELIEPVDLENMEGLPVSIESIHETYSGGQDVGGVVGTDEGDIPNYPADEESNDGEYELVKETINNEFNKIRKDIVESPFKVRDLGIQVAVDNVLEKDGNEIQYLTQQEQSAVESRSEEHTSELQSRGHLVCCLLLEKTNVAQRIQRPQTGIDLRATMVGSLLIHCL